MLFSQLISTSLAMGTLCTGTLCLASSAPAAADESSARAPRFCSLTQRNEPLVLHRELPAPSRDGAARATIVRVFLSHEGQVQKVLVVQSSGDPKFDAASLLATGATAFAPAARSCVAIDSNFRYALSSKPGGAVEAAVLPGASTVLAIRGRTH